MPAAGLVLSQEPRLTQRSNPPPPGPHRSPRSAGRHSWRRRPPRARPRAASPPRGARAPRRTARAWASTSARQSRECPWCPRPTSRGQSRSVGVRRRLRDCSQLGGSWEVRPWDVRGLLAGDPRAHGSSCPLCPQEAGGRGGAIQQCSRARGQEEAQPWLRGLQLVVAAGHCAGAGRDSGLGAQSRPSALQ